MKITVNVELTESEASTAPQVQQAFADISDTVTTKIVSDLPKLALFIREGSNSPKVDSVVIPEVTRRLMRTELQADCIQTICDILFSQAIVDSHTPVNVCMMIAKLPDIGVRTLVKDALLNKIVDQLAQPRDLDTQRQDFLPYAEAFGTMTQVELVPLKSALAVVMELMLSDRTRCAAMTALGKIVEHNYEAILSHIDQGTRDELRNLVATCQENHFLYDVEYISEALSWSSNRTYQNANPKMSLKHHRSPILAMAGCFDEAGRKIIVSASADGEVATWDALGGKLFQSFTLDRHFACAMDVIYSGTGLLVAGASRQQSRSAPSIVLYGSDPQTGAWVEKFGCEPVGGKVVTTVRGMPGAKSFSFCAGIAMSNNTHSIELFDTGRGMIQSTRQIRDHSDTITALAAPSDATVISGSRDSTVMIHDMRAASSTINLLEHSSTVSGISCVNNYLATGGLDRRVVLYDMRMVHQPVAQRDLDSAVISVSLTESGHCYVATQGGLHALNATQTGMPASFLVGVPSSQTYNCVLAHSASQSLFVAGESKTIDVLTIEQ